MNNTDDPGLSLTPTGKRVLLAVIIIGFVILLAWAISSKAEASDLAGNLGGCPVASRRYDLSCTVQNAGVGWASIRCQYGEYALFQTVRTFVPQQPVTVKQGCVDNHNTLYSAPGFPLRIR